MADTIPGSVNGLMSAFASAYDKYGSQQYCYAAPTNYTYMGMNSYYWCAGFVVWQFNQIGLDLRNSLSQWGYCPSVENYMYASPDWITVSYPNARAGDVILFKKNGEAYHIGIVSGSYNPATGILPTHEGDTSNPNISMKSDSVGGCYAYKTRYMPNFTTGGHSVHIFRHTFLNATSSPSTTSTGSAAAVANVLQVGSTGLQVAHLQAALNKVFPAYCPQGGLATDGQYGPLTASAVTKFQAAAHIACDGIVGADTLAALAHYGIKL